MASAASSTGFESGRPKVSTMTTDSGRSDSTAEATSPVMPATVCGDSGRELRSLSTTDALAGCESLV